MTLQDRIKNSIERNPHHADWRIAKNLNTVAPEVAAVRAKIGTLPPSQPEPTIQVAGGVSLSSKRVLPRKPPESAAKFIKRLPKGRGFSPVELAQQWGMAEETIRRHAKDMGCFKYVEVSEDDWVGMIMHPDTAAQY
jgi:hypothetical protein